MKQLNIKVMLCVCLLILAFIVGCAEIQSTSPDVSVKRFSVYKQKTLDELGSFDFERRMYIYETMDELANQLWKSPKRLPLKKAKKETFEKFPILMLSDNDLDGKADEFAYLPEKGKDTQEFGFIFDLNRDGKIDYIVFNCGPIFNKNLKFAWAYYHGIDTNYDGKVDIFVYSNNITLDDDKFFDEGVSGWIYDTDFDGEVDKAEYLGEDFIKPVEKIEGVFIIKTIAGEEKWGEKRSFKKDFWLNSILTDINSLMP